MRRCWVLVAGCLAVAGCGGSTTTATETVSAPSSGTQTHSITKADYIAAADDICSRYQSTIEDAQASAQSAVRSGDVDAAANHMQEAVKASQDEIDKLDALAKPKGDEEIVTTMLASVRSSNALFTRVVDDFRSGSYQEAQALSQEARSAADKARGIATAYGFKVCGKTSR